MDTEVTQLALALRTGRTVTDTQFDVLLPIRPRIRSLSYWSSVEVSQTASRWFSDAGAQRVLDVGSGAGKFCAIASLTSGRRVWGIEARADLAQASRVLAEKLGAEVTLLEGTLDGVDASHFDGFYFFNPFAEQLAEPHERYDEHMPGSVDDFLHDVRVVERWLRAAPLGTAMITYNGLGGRIPLSWEAQQSVVLGGDHLRLWLKRSNDDSRDAILEINEHLIPASKLAALMKGGDSRVKSSSLVARLVSVSE